MLDDLDRLLREEESLTPDPGFSAAVMREVLRQAAMPPPIPFPWRRPALWAGAGLLCALILLFVATRFPGTLEALAGSPVATATVALALHLPGALPPAPLALLVAALLGSYLVVRFALRLSGEWR